MAKLESRLPFFQTLRQATTEVKSYGEKVSKYIIQEDERKLSDYEPKISDIQITDSVVKLAKDRFNAKTTGIKKPTSLPVNSISSSIQSPVRGLKKPSTQIMSPATSTPQRKVASNESRKSNSSTSLSKVSGKVSQLPQQPSTIASGLRKPPTVSTKQVKPAPTVPPKPVLAKDHKPQSPTVLLASKISQPQNISNRMTHPLAYKALQPPSESSPIQIIEKPKQKEVSPASPAIRESKLIQSVKRGNSQEKIKIPSPTKNSSPTKIIPPSRLYCAKRESSIMSSQQQVFASSSSEKPVPTPRLMSTSAENPRFSLNRSEQAPVDSTQGNTTISSENVKRASTGSKLAVPTRSTSGLRKPSQLRKSLPARLANVHKCEVQIASAHLEHSAVISPTLIEQPQLSRSHVEECKLALDHTNFSYAASSVTMCNLHSVLNVSEIQTSLATVSVTSYQLNQNDVSKVHSFCGPSKAYEEEDEVFHATPFTENAEQSQCYTYIQQAVPSSYRKKLINSFTVKEQLSPTAESHARHIASSIPHPWLSADIIENANDENSPPIELLIPDPPIQDLSERKSKLHSIDERDEVTAEMTRIVNKPAPFTFTSETPSESVNEMISEHNKQSQAKSPLKSPSLLGNFFSKIGGKRILTRPQESPPRVRKVLSTTASHTATRRKVSPKLKRREMKNLRPSKPIDQLSPKHKPSSQDDSPIRSKEPYYGGAHYHTSIIAVTGKSNSGSCSNGDTDNNSSPRFPSNSSENISKPAVSVSENTASNQSSQLFEVKASALKRCDTPQTDLNEMCRDDHMKFYSSGYANRSISHRPRRTSSGSYSPAMTSSNVMSRSLSYKKKHKGSVDDGAKFLTHYSSILRMGLPPCPELTKDHVEQGNSALSKVSVAVRLKQSGETTNNNSNSYIVADPGRGQLILRDPSNESNMAPSCRRQLAAVPKFFAFDTVFGGDAMQMDVCKDTVLEILQSVLQGSDGCITSFGQSKTGKSRSLIGTDTSCTDFGVVPTAMSWLYHLIEEHKNKTGARFSIRISALEIRGKNEELTDLLADCQTGQENTPVDHVQLTSTPVYGAQIENLKELRAPDAEQAGYYLDAALTASHTLNESSETKGSHFLFTLHIYQHHIESKPSPGGALIAGGRSRLHFIDIGPCAKSSSDGSALTLAALGSAITALLNGQRHFPQKESKLATLLKDSVGHANCRTCILVHISTQPSQYSETLQILQLAARIHRMKVRRKNKISSNSSDDTGSTNSNLRRRRGIRMGTSSSLSDPDVSSSEQSIDTVIYVPGGKHRHPHQSPTVYRTSPAMSKHQLGRTQNPAVVTAAVNGSAYNGSPYNTSGAIKKKLSDDETSSEGRRRMPRTNARVWPRANPAGNEAINQKEYWLDAAPPPIPRDQWHIAGNANPLPHKNSYYSTPHQQHQMYQQQHYQQPQHIDLYSSPNHYATPFTDNSSPTPWISLAQYNGHPGQIGHMTHGGHVTQGGHMTQANPARQAWVDSSERGGGANGTYPEISKQELWVDGPTAFRKNIEGLTNNLHTDELSPTKKHHRYHSVNHNGVERGDKSKHQHRVPSRKHRESNKHCHQCGADIKKEPKTETAKQTKVEEPSVSECHNETGEPTVAIKSYVKDWVLRHSENNTPNKAQDVCDSVETTVQNKKTNPQTREELLDRELREQEDFQLTVDLGMCTDEELKDLHNLPCSDNLMQDISDFDNQDEVQIDDSVSNVTADDKVGFESKEGSSFDENSLSEEIVEVCDAACQTEFTDSDTHSIQSSTAPPQGDSGIAPSIDSVAVNSIGRNLAKRDSTEAFLNATLQGTMLRKPDGASDPSLHKELVSPSTERKYTESLTKTKCHSNTLPRNAHLTTPTNVQQSPNPQTIKLQPYLSSPRQSPQLPRRSTSTLPKSNHHQPRPDIIEPSTPTHESKIKKPSFFTQLSSDKQDKTLASPGKKSKGSKLPSLRLSAKPKESKLPNSAPIKKLESSKKEKKSMLTAPGSVKNSPKTEALGFKPASKLPCAGSSSTKYQTMFDVTSSPYRQYVLPKPSYAHSDGYSDNSSCPSNPLASQKYSTSSGYDSMTLNSAEDISQVSEENSTQKQTEKAIAGPWLNSAKSNTKCKELDKIYEQRYLESQLSENLTKQARIEELLYRQELLKREMAEAKHRLMVPASSWNYDSSMPSLEMNYNLHVASQIERRNDEGYLEALEKETTILQRRVDACKSRIMLVTSIL